MNLSQILLDAYKVSPWMSDQFKNYDNLGEYIERISESAEHFTMERGVQVFFASGCFDTTIRYKRGVYKYIAAKPTKAFKEALKSDTTIMKHMGVQFLIDTTKSFRMAINDLGSPEFIRCARIYNRNPENAYNTISYIQSGFVEVTNGRLSITKQAQIRIDRYKENALRYCEGILKADWRFQSIQMDTRTSAPSSISFATSNINGTGYYYFQMMNPKMYNRSGDNEINHDGTKTVLNAADVLPELFYPLLAKAFPECMKLMLPMAILQGFNEARELLSLPVEQQSIETPSETITDTAVTDTQNTI